MTNTQSPKFEKLAAGKYIASTTQGDVTITRTNGVHVAYLLTDDDMIRIGERVTFSNTKFMVRRYLAGEG
jgi:hypothetical protein